MTSERIENAVNGQGSGIATCLGRRNPEARGYQLLYRLNPPMSRIDWDEEQRIEYVIVSAASAPVSGPETYIFPANAEGEITDWGELDGSYRGGLDHAEALRRAGYDASPVPASESP